MPGKFDGPGTGGRSAVACFRGTDHIARHGSNHSNSSKKSVKDRDVDAVMRSERDDTHHYYFASNDKQPKASRCYSTLSSNQAQLACARSEFSFFVFVVEHRAQLQVGRVDTGGDNILKSAFLCLAAFRSFLSSR